MSIKGKKILVYDWGLFTENAARLVRDGATVFYYVPWQEAFPKSTKAIIGENFDGLQKIEPPKTFWSYIDKVDFLYFPDTHCGDLVEYLKGKGYSVAGVGRAEILELDRWKGRLVQKEVGLPTQNTRKVKGFDALVKILKNEKDLVVKLNIFRGDVETFIHDNYADSEPLLDNIKHELGRKAEHIEFIVEKKLEGSEPGLDGIVFDGDNLSPCMVGYEIKGSAYVGRIMLYKDVCIQLKRINDKLAPIFKKMKTRFFFSTEVIIPDRIKGYLIDYTCRGAAPCVSAIQTELIENFGDVIEGLATGKKVQPVMKYKYAVGVPLESEQCDKNWLKVEVSKDVKQWFKFRMACKLDGNYYVVPGFKSVGSVIALANTVQEAVRLVQERAIEIKAHQLDKNLSGLDDIEKRIEKGKAVGITF